MRGIDRYFERYYAKGPRRRPVRVEFCEADVLDVFDEWRRAVGHPGRGRLGQPTRVSRRQTEPSAVAASRVAAGASRARRRAADGAARRRAIARSTRRSTTIVRELDARAMPVEGAARRRRGRRCSSGCARSTGRCSTRRVRGATRRRCRRSRPRPTPSWRRFATACRPRRTSSHAGAASIGSFASDAGCRSSRSNDRARRRSLTLDVEKPAAGGRMLARHEGQVVLVWGAIPGERVTARVERAGKGVAYADTSTCCRASPDRRAVAATGAAAATSSPTSPTRGSCSSRARSSPTPSAASAACRSSRSRGDRIAGARLPDARAAARPRTAGSASTARARTSCAMPPRPASWPSRRTRGLPLRRRRFAARTPTGLAAIEIAENVAGNERACHLDLHAGV